MSSKIVTNIEQSRRLLSAGVKHETADAFYVGRLRFNGNDYELTGESNMVIKERGTDEWYDDLLKNFGISMAEDEGVYFMPAWSMSRLWDMLNEVDKTYEIPTELTSAEVIDVLVTTIINNIEDENN